MRIQIQDQTTFIITEQSVKAFKEYTYISSLGMITVCRENSPEVYYGPRKILVFVRGSSTRRDNNLLIVRSPDHMPHILKALKEFCTFNDEPFEIESCIL